MADGAGERSARPAVDGDPDDTADAVSPDAATPPVGSREAARAPDPGRPDGRADRFGYRAFLRRHRTLEMVYRAAVAVLGVAIIITGFALIPLPGPGWLIVFAGLALLATEFAWAERLLHYARDKWQAWTRWIMRQSLVVRGLVTLLGLAVVVGVLGLYVQVQGVPDWLPVVG